jgi:hypothetical protein
MDRVSVMRFAVSELSPEKTGGVVALATVVVSVYVPLPEAYVSGLTVLLTVTVLLLGHVTIIS